MDASQGLLFLGGLVLLVGGAELLVRGASNLATALGIPPLVVGLTVVALGTSAPELAISVGSVLSGEAALAVGNVVGSNIANVLLILGLTALIAPLVVKSQLVRFDVPVMIGASLLVWALAADGDIDRKEGLLLILLLVTYIGVLIRKSRTEQSEVIEEFESALKQPQSPPLVNIGLVVAGLVLLVVGSNLLLDAAVAIAAELGLSELVIGLTLVAAGTSLPEIATSILAAVRGQRDIAVGNAIGSNLFNLLAVLGITSVVAENGVAVAIGALDFDIPFMVAVAIACLPIFLTGHLIARWEGAVFVGYYLAYTAYLVLNATEHDLLEPFSSVMIQFVVPLTIVTIVASLLGWRRRFAAPV
ncbi:MAG: calcium/sodium antiporter [Acidimicrobiia bacterium]